MLIYGKDLALSVILTAEISFDIFPFFVPFLILSPSSPPPPFCGHQKLNGEVHAPADRSLPTPVAYSSTYSLDHVPPARTSKEHLYQQKCMCVLQALSSKCYNSQKDAVVTGAQEASCLLSSPWGYLKAPRSSAFKRTSLVWFSPVCSNVQFHFFLFFSISFSISYHRSHFEKPYLSHNSSHPHLLAQHYWRCFVPSLCRTEVLLLWPQRLPQTGPGNSTAKIKQHGHPWWSSG